MRHALPRQYNNLTYRGSLYSFFISALYPTYLTTLNTFSLHPTLHLTTYPRPCPSIKVWTAVCSAFVAYKMWCNV